MTPVEIKIELMRRGITQQEIADELNLKKSVVSLCIHGHRRCPPVRRAIARKLKMPMNKIFNEHHPQLIKRQTQKAA